MALRFPFHGRMWMQLQSRLLYTLGYTRVGA